VLSKKARNVCGLGHAVPKDTEGVLGESIQLILLSSSDDLAAALGFAGPNDVFRGFCQNLCITPVCRNPNFYDPKLVPIRLDEAQGLQASNQAAGEEKLFDTTGGELRRHVEAGNCPDGIEALLGEKRWDTEKIRRIISGEAATDLGDVEW
jgi:hypothetical protein